ncbi:MAG: hypothetical protein ACOCRK_09850 [bacterium]
MNKISWKCFIWSGIITILSVIGIILLLLGIVFLAEYFPIMQAIVGIIVILFFVLIIFLVWSDLYEKCKYKEN